MKLSKRLLIMGIALLMFLGASFVPGLSAGARFLGVLCVLLTLVLGYHFIYRPLEKAELTLTMLQKNPSWEEPPEASQNPLLRALQEANESFKREMNQAYSASVLGKQAQIGVLQNQINPHFLYNTLEAIRGEALEQGCTDIANMSKALASFFRYSISLKEDIVTLADELTNIRNYFVIQEYRFDNKFSLDIQIEDEEALGYYLPKLTIQPIVENAIFHGLETKFDSGVIVIRVLCAGERFKVVISDDGAGMDENTLESIRNKLKTGQKIDSAVSSGNGIALQNVNRRIQILFGEEYGMAVYSTPNVGTDVELLFPTVTNIEELTSESVL